MPNTVIDAYNVCWKRKITLEITFWGSLYRVKNWVCYCNLTAGILKKLKKIKSASYTFVHLLSKTICEVHIIVSSSQMRKQILEKNVTLLWRIVAFKSRRWQKYHWVEWEYFGILWAHVCWRNNRTKTLEPEFLSFCTVSTT